MRINLIHNDKQKLNHWAGGTTTELLIYPEQAEYEKRNFLWRISSATIELEESAFTNLPGFNRVLMLLEGNLKIEHEDHGSIQLKPFRQDRFKGEWATKSYGRAIDFNLIMDKSCYGEVEAIHLDHNNPCKVSKYKEKGNFDCISEAFYIVKGSAVVKVDDNSPYIMKSGDVLSISACMSKVQPDIEITKLETAELIMVRSLVYYYQ
jgi:environmental stress-induced protein Ves